jgi:hypothetical protein
MKHARPPLRITVQLTRLIRYALGVGCFVQVVEWLYAPTRHAKAIVMSMAHSVYLQCSECGVAPGWKVAPVSGPRFWRKMSLQMVQYKLSNLQYLENAKMHKTMQMKKKCGKSDMALTQCEDHIKQISHSQYLDEKKPCVRKTWLCANNMTLLKMILNSMKRVHVASCQMWGQKNHTWSISCARSMFVLRVERVCLVYSLALISMMIYCMT